MKHALDFEVLLIKLLGGLDEARRRHQPLL